MKDLVCTGENGRVLTTSLVVAEMFKVEHKYVLRKIRKLTEKNFPVGYLSLSHYYNAQNHKQPMYVMDRDAFSQLALTFQGNRAGEFRANYINAFNRMENHIREVSEPKSDLPSFDIEQTLANLHQSLSNLIAHITKRDSEIDSLRKEMEEVKNSRLALPPEEQLISFEELPIATALPPVVSLRTAVKKAVAYYAENICPGNEPDYRSAWKFFYNAFQDRYHRRPLENKQKKITKLDWIQQNGLLQDFYNLVKFYIDRLNL